LDIRRLGGPLLAVAAALAVALAVLVASPDTAQAVIQDITDGTGDSASADAENGETVLIADATAAEDDVIAFTILPSSTASASFTHGSATNNGQNIICQVDGPCDVDIDTDGDGTPNPQDGVQVALKVADDSPAGFILVTSQPLTGTVDETQVVTTNVITVKRAQVPAKLRVTPAAKAIDAVGSGDSGSTLLTIRLTDTQDKPIGDAPITVVSTRGLLSSVAGFVDATGKTYAAAPATPATEEVAASGTLSGVLAGTMRTSEDTAGDTIDSAGYVFVTVRGAGAATPGVTTITVTAGTVTGSAEIVLYGPVATITAEPEQSAIELGGTTFIVVTATDKGGNPVVGVRADVKTGASGIVGPEGSTVSTEVDVNNDIDKDANKDQKADTGDYPACGDQEAAVDDPGTADVDEFVPGLLNVGPGTNSAGKCVIEITAQDESGTANDAARGTHTVTINALATAGTLANTKVAPVEVEIQVGGAPATIEHDAPERIDSLDEVTVNLTVLDDEGVRVGRVYYTVDKISEGGVFTSANVGRTTDGRAKFSFLAPFTPGASQFLVRTWNTKDDGTQGTTQTARELIEIEVGDEPAPPPEPTLTPTLNPSPVGANTISVFSGGTVDELIDLVVASCESGVAVWATDYTGAFISHVPGAPEFINRAFAQLFADGVPANTGVLISNCS